MKESSTCRDTREYVESEENQAGCKERVWECGFGEELHGGGDSEVTGFMEFPVYRLILE